MAPSAAGAFDRLRWMLRVCCASVLLASVLAIIDVAATTRVAGASNGLAAATPVLAVNPTNPGGSGDQQEFWVGINGDIYQTKYLGSGNGWSNPVNLGWYTTGDRPAVALDNAGNEWVFWLGSNGHIWETWSTDLGSTWHGPADKGWSSASDPALGVNPSNSYTYVFFEAPSGALTEEYNNGTSTWTTKTFSEQTTTTPSAGVDDSGTQFVYYQGTNGDINEVFYNGTWNGPKDFTTWTSNAGSPPSVAVNPSSGYQYVFWQGANNVVWTAHYEGTWGSPNEPSSSWTTTTGPSAAADDASPTDLWASWEGAGGYDGSIYESWTYLDGGDRVWVTPVAQGWYETIPVQTTSYYESTVDTGILKQQGEDAGSSGSSDQPTPGLIVLDFGQDAYDGTDYGSCLLLYNGGTCVFAKFSAILAGAEAFAQGYYDTAPSGAITTIAIGTNNCYDYGSGTPCLDQESNGQSVEMSSSEITSYGTAFSNNVNALQNYIVSNTSYTNEYGEGAIDAETEYDPTYTGTYDMVNSFNNNSTQLLIDIGNADGAGDWSPSNTYQIAYGFNDDYPAPEIYDCPYPGCASSANNAIDPETLTNEWIDVFEAGGQIIDPYILVYNTNFSYSKTSFNDLAAGLAGCGCDESELGINDMTSA